MSEELEEAILAHSLKHPTHGPLRVSQDLMLQGVAVSSGGVRGVWSRDSLLTKHERLMRLERKTRVREVELTPQQVRQLERFSPEFRERHIEVHHTGELVAVDTFFVGTLKGVGRVYLQSFIDCFGRHVWGRLYTSKLPLTAVHVLDNDLQPFFKAQVDRVESILSDNGREFCGRPDRHPYELFLQPEEIEHRTTQVRRPQSNSFIQRMLRTLLDEHFRTAGRTKWYEALTEMQKVLDADLNHYNNERPHQGRGMNERIPVAVFKSGLQKPSKTRKEQPITDAA